MPSKIPFAEALQRLDARRPDGTPVPFDITYVTHDAERPDQCGRIVTLKGAVRARYAKNLPRQARREFVPTARRAIPQPALQSDIIRLYLPSSGQVRACHQRLIVALNGREVTY